MNKPLRILLPIGIVALAIMLVGYMVSTKPKPKKKDDPPVGTLVEVAPAKEISERLILRAHGVVTPAKQIILSPEVAARVRKLHPEVVPGGIVKENDRIVWLDGVDYQLQVKQQLAQVESALTQLELEQSRAEVAKREWELLGKDQNKASALALRKPQLKNAQVAAQSAQSGLRIARRNAQKTILKAPFNAQIRAENIDPGQLVSPGSQMIDLVGTDAYWVQVSVPADSLGRIRARSGDQTGADVKVIQMIGDDEVHWQGHVIRKLPDLDPVGRMARVLIEVKDPLELSKPEAERRPAPLLINEYVKVEIDAGQIDNVIKVPRKALRDGRYVWIMNDESKLDKKNPTIIWRDRDFVLARDGIKSGDQLIISSIATPVTGMMLRRYDGAVEKANGAASGSDKPAVNNKGKNGAKDTSDDNAAAKINEATAPKAKGSE